MLLRRHTGRHSLLSPPSIPSGTHCYALLPPAELESVCVEAYYLEAGVMDQRAFAAAFDATFVQASQATQPLLLPPVVCGLAWCPHVCAAPTNIVLLLESGR